MGIAGRGETEVAEILRRIARLLHGAQHQERNRLLLRLAVDPLEQLLEVFRPDSRRRRTEAVAEAGDELLEALDLQQVRLLVHAIERRRRLLLEKRRDGFVGQEHELLDQAMRDVPLERDDRLDHAALVDDHFGLVQIEVDRPAPAARVVQDLKEVAHQLEHRHERRVARQQLRVAIGQNPVDRGVGHALVAVDHAVVKLVPDDAAVTIDFHQARLHEPVDVRIQAAQPGRQLRGEHVDGALGKVDRRGALVRLAVEGAAFLDVVRHVGDVDAEPVVAVRQRLERDRVVEIARMLAVDGDGRHVSKIGPAANVALGDRRGRGERLPRSRRRRGRRESRTCG